MQRELEPDALINVYEHAIEQCKREMKTAASNVRTHIFARNQDAAARDLRRQTSLMNEANFLEKVLEAEHRRVSSEDQ